MRRDNSGDAVVFSREFMGVTTLFVVEKLEKKIYVTISGEEALKYRVGDRVVYKLNEKLWQRKQVVILFNNLLEEVVEC